MPTSDHEYKPAEFRMEGVLKQKHSEMNADCRTRVVTNTAVNFKQCTLLCLKPHYYWPTYKWVCGLQSYYFSSYQCLFWTSGALFILNLKTNMGKKTPALTCRSSTAARNDWPWQ